MTTYYLEKNRLIPIDKESPFLEVSQSNFNDFTHVIQQSIDLFNSELTWDEMFSMEISHNRILIGHRMFIGIENNKVYGYFWVKPIPHGYHIYNVFSSKNRTNRSLTARHLLSTVINTFHEAKKCTADIDDWNTKSINLFTNLGFKKIISNDKILFSYA